MSNKCVEAVRRYFEKIFCEGMFRRLDYCNLLLTYITKRNLGKWAIIALKFLTKVRVKKWLSITLSSCIWVLLTNQEDRVCVVHVLGYWQFCRRNCQVANFLSRLQLTQLHQSCTAVHRNQQFKMTTIMLCESKFSTIFVN